MFYSFYILRDAFNSDDDSDYFHSFMLFKEIIEKDPTRPEPYYYIGFFYEIGIIILNCF